MGWGLPHVHWMGMTGGQGPTKRHNPEIWATSLHRVWQWANLCVWDNPDLVQDTRSQMEAPYCLRATKLWASWVHELDPQYYVSYTLLGDPVTLGQCATPSLTLSLMHPEVLRLFSLWDLIWETTPSDRKAQERPPATRCPDISWPWEKSYAISPEKP